MWKVAPYLAECFPPSTYVPSGIRSAFHTQISSFSPAWNTALWKGQSLERGKYILIIWGQVSSPLWIENGEKREYQVLRNSYASSILVSANGTWMYTAKQVQVSRAVKHGTKSGLSITRHVEADVVVGCRLSWISTREWDRGEGWNKGEIFAPLKLPFCGEDLFRSTKH